ncbi:MAG: hypothetical protein HQ591_00905 [candidate division Zixibacteria bacterium]|nr:hypothetical protein [Candidatus Tariuqbacter arcticus]
MVKTLLVEQDISDGESLIKAIEETGFQIKAALWYYFPESETWRLIIASPEYDRKGSKEVYSIIHSILLEVQPPIGLDITDISVVSPNKDIIKVLTDIFGGGKDVWRMRLGHQVIGNIYIDDAILYRV